MSIGRKAAVGVEFGPLKLKAGIGKSDHKASLTVKRFFEGDLRLIHKSPLQGDSAFREVGLSFLKWKLGVADGYVERIESTSPRVPYRENIVDSWGGKANYSLWTRDALKFGVHVSLFGGASISINLGKILDPYQDDE